MRHFAFDKASEPAGLVCLGHHQPTAQNYSLTASTRLQEKPNSSSVNLTNFLQLDISLPSLNLSSPVRLFSTNSLQDSKNPKDTHSPSKRFGSGPPASQSPFILDALSLAMQDKRQRSFSKSPGLTRHFRRVLLQDSTQQNIPKSNHEHFPAHGNGKSVTAGVKVDLPIDLLHGHNVLANLHGATEQDRDLGKNLVDLVRKRDLILRDRGYFVINEFRLIARKGAFWLSRVPPKLHISDQWALL